MMTAGLHTAANEQGEVAARACDPTALNTEQLEVAVAAATAGLHIAVHEHSEAGRGLTGNLIGDWFLFF